MVSSLINRIQIEATQGKLSLNSYSVTCFIHSFFFFLIETSLEIGNRQESVRCSYYNLRSLVPTQPKNSVLGLWEL